MPRNEFGAAADVATATIRSGVGRIEAVHRAIARRSWRPTGAAGAPSHAVHDSVAAGVYGSVKVAFGVAGAIAGTVLDGVASVAGWRPISDSSAGGPVLGVVNGFAGDHLAEQRSALALPMTVRHCDRDLTLEVDELRFRLPDASGDLVLFLHGLAETDRSWRWGARRYGDDPASSFGERLRASLGFTPLYLRYNTGLRIPENGRRLADVLDELVAAWPVPVEQLALVGHSMGGLVIRSACHIGARDGRSWVPRVRHAVYLGTPHLGAPLARGAVALGSVLVNIPEVRPFAALLERPSAGIRDLRHGVLVDDDDAVGPDGVAEGPGAWFGDRDRDIALLPNCRHHAVVATVARRPDSILDLAVGDLMVRTTSASGRGTGRRRVDFVAEEGLNLPGANHFALLNHPTVYEQLESWLGSSPSSP